MTQLSEKMIFPVQTPPVAPGPSALIFASQPAVVVLDLPLLSRAHTQPAESLSLTDGFLSHSLVSLGWSESFRVCYFQLSDGDTWCILTQCIATCKKTFNPNRNVMKLSFLQAVYTSILYSVALLLLFLIYCLLPVTFNDVIHCWVVT